MGSVWRRLGTKVTVVEFLDRICPSLDGEIGQSFQKILAKQGIQFKLSTKVRACAPCQPPACCSWSRMPIRPLTHTTQRPPAGGGGGGEG